jgi:hypothetical protein
MFQKYDIHDFRYFAEKIEWFTPEIFAMFFYGTNSKEALKYAHSRLRDLQKSKNPTNRFKQIDGYHKKAYACLSSTRPHIGVQHALHDERLRIALAKLAHCDRRNLDLLTLEKPADAKIGGLYIELDKGTETLPYLIKKIKTHYLKGNFQVIFIMSISSTSKATALDRIKWRENQRVTHLTAEVAKLFPKLPNKILITPYHQFLEEGCMFNLKGENKA